MRKPEQMISADEESLRLTIKQRPAKPDARDAEFNEQLLSVTSYDFAGRAFRVLPALLYSVLKSERLALRLSNCCMKAGSDGSLRKPKPFVIAQRCSHEMPTAPV